MLEIGVPFGEIESLEFHGISAHEGLRAARRVREVHGPESRKRGHEVVETLPVHERLVRPVRERPARRLATELGVRVHVVAEQAFHDLIVQSEVRGKRHQALGRHERTHAGVRSGHVAIELAPRFSAELARDDVLSRENGDSADVH